MTIYVAAAGGGVWKTIDGGATWMPLTDTQATLSMGAIAVAPSNPNIIYAGTGEGNGGNSNYGRGILVSADGGNKWILRPGPLAALDRHTVSQIAIDPSDPHTAYAAVGDDSNNNGYGNTGIWKTTDGGFTWTNTTATIDSRDSWSSIQIDPDNPSTLYAALGNKFSSSLNGVYKSLDGGGSWSLLAGDPNAGRIVIAIAPSNSQVLYVAAATTRSGALYKIMRSDNGGASFTDLTSGTPNYMGSQGWFDTTLIVDPSDSASVYAGGQKSILRSTNGGVNWTNISFGGGSHSTSPHVNHHAVAFDAIGKLLDGNGGGIYRLDDATIPSWSNLNGNLQTMQFESIGLHPTNPNIAIGGSLGNGTGIFNGNLLWTETDGGNGGMATFSKTNEKRVYHQIPVLFGDVSFFRRSDDGGFTWTTKTSISVDAINQNFYHAPFVVDPGNGDHVLFGTNRIWETTNGDDAWTPISSVGSNGWNPPNANVDAIGLAASDPNTIYAAAAGSVFVSSNHGATWTQRTLFGVLDLQVDPTNSLIAYAVNFVYDVAGHVFRTIDGGLNWADISGNLPKLPVWSLQIDPAAPGTLYVGTDDGVYVTVDFGSFWSRFGEGLPHVQVYQIELNTNLKILGAGTHGRGMWEILTGNPPPPAVTITKNQISDRSPTDEQLGRAVTGRLKGSPPAEKRAAVQYIRSFQKK